MSARSSSFHVRSATSSSFHVRSATSSSFHVRSATSSSFHVRSATSSSFHVRSATSSSFHVRSAFVFALDLLPSLQQLPVQNILICKNTQPKMWSAGFWEPVGRENTTSIQIFDIDYILHFVLRGLHCYHVPANWLTNVNVPSHQAGYSLPTLVPHHPV